MSFHSDTIENEPARPGAAFLVGIALIMSSAWMFVWQGSLDGVFHFDDYSNIVDNERIRRLWPLDDFIHNNRPIGLYSFAINYRLSGAEPYAYHVTNLSIHICNGLFLWTGCLLSWRLYRKHWSGEPQPQSTYSVVFVAGLIATAWVVHPLTTQAVTNIVQRYESLASMGYLGVWLAMLLWLDGHRWTGCLLMLPMAWIGLMSKEIFASAPLAIFLFDKLLTRGTWLSIAKKRWLPYTLLLSPFTWFVPSVLRFFDPVRTAEGSMGIGLRGISPWQYLRTQPEVIWHYVGLTLWPRQLCFDYVWRIQDNPWIYLPLGASIVSLIVFAGLAYWRTVTNGGSFASGLAGWLTLLFFFILAPTSSIMPIADIAFEHRMYLASAVVVAGCCLLGAYAARKLLQNSPHPIVLKTAFSCIAASAICLLAWRTHLRNFDYRDELVLWKTVTDTSPKNPRAWYAIGRVHVHHGDRESALQPMIKAVEYSNTSIPIHDVGLADCLYHLGRYDDAIKLYSRAISTKFYYPQAHNDLGAVFLTLDRLEEAEQSFVNAVEMDYPIAKYNLALVYSRQGKTGDAIDLWEETLADDPTLHAAARRLAWTLATTSDADVKDVQRAEKLLLDHYDLNRNQYAKSTAATTRPASVASVSPRANSAGGIEGEESSRQRQNAYVLDAWAAILAAKGDFDEAIDVASQALAIAESESNESLVKELTARLAGYRRGEPCVDGVQP